MDHITQLIREMSDGDTDAADAVYGLVYEQLRQIARRRMAFESSDHTLQPTALVNEAFLRLVKTNATSWRDRRHFFGVAAEAMRRILIDAARSKKRLKRGGKEKARKTLEEDSAIAAPIDTDLLDLDEAINELEDFAPERAELVRLHFFSGLTLQECAEVLEVSKSTAERSWRFSRAWLKNRIGHE